MNKENKKIGFLKIKQKVKDLKKNQLRFAFRWLLLSF